MKTIGILAIAVIVGLGLVMVRAYAGSSETTGSDTKTGALDDYFAQIAALSSGPDENFFVIAQAIGQPHFVQVSVGMNAGVRGFQFDIPVTDWSTVYADKIEAEARRRGLTPVRVDGGPMDFLDVDFASQDAHDTFARWVVTEVFGMADDTQFEIAWGNN